MYKNDGFLFVILALLTLMAVFLGVYLYEPSDTITSACIEVMQENNLGIMGEINCRTWQTNNRAKDPVNLRMCENQYREDGDAFAAYQCVINQETTKSEE